MVVGRNRLIPIIGVLAMVLFVGLGVRTCDSDNPRTPLLDAVPESTNPEADTPADTIQTLTANVAAMTSELQALRRENDRLHQENSGLTQERSGLEQSLDSRIEKTLSAREQRLTENLRTQSAALDGLRQRLDQVSSSLQQQRLEVSAIPPEFRFDSSEYPMSEGEWHWIEPLDQLPQTDLTLDRLSSRLRTDNRSAESSLEPVYTVPRNATLLDATAMTALVGRVPISGEVRDPMPFKVITGADNLAANGLRVPGVRGMVWSGTAIGDWTLGCVSGRLNSVTFVFADGTIRTLSSDDQSLQNDGSTSKDLGWISDARGVPCVSGARKTNAASYLAQRIATQAVNAAGDAASAAETTSIISNNGAIQDRVTGDLERFIYGRTLSGSADELSNWLAERQTQSFDAIFVPAGVPIAIHVDRALPIDYHPQGRRLAHDNS